MTSDLPSEPTPLARRIRLEIEAGGPIPFSRFMEQALYDPEFGYYARGAERLGPPGDFFTASDVGRAFGRCVTRQLHEMDGRLGHPERFHVLELGGGRGLLARDVLDAAGELDPTFAARLRYDLADASPGMRESACREAPEARVVRPEDVAGEVVGCVLAVELFDALPVHRVRRRDGRLREVFVGAGPGDSLAEVEGEPLPEARALAERYGAAPEENDEAEVCPAAIDQLDAVDRVLDRGFVAIVDYGYDAGELYGPAHNRGTLLAYHRHRTNEDYLARVGEQDLTAHVNFSALEDRARELGLDVLGRSTQDRFLIANGILEPFDETDSQRWNDPARVRERLQVMQLIHPEGMGRIFHVLLLSKGIPAGLTLAGLRDPFAR